MYSKFLKSYIAAWIASQSREKSLLENIVKLHVRRDSISDEIEDIINRLTVRIGDRRYLEVELRRLAKLLRKENVEQFAAIIKDTLQIDIFPYGKDIEQIIDLWVTSNIDLIRKLQFNHIAKLAFITQNTIIAQNSASKLEEEIKKAEEIAKKHTELIAVDQIGKLNSAFDQQVNKEFGIEQYIWKTAQDIRVRPWHRTRNNHVFDWDKPPDDGHPGQPIRCRCIALPVIDTDAIAYRGIVPLQKISGKRAVESAEVFKNLPRGEVPVTVNGKIQDMKSGSF